LLIRLSPQTFLFIRPTAANLASYERWSGSEIQNHTWLGDMVDKVTRVELREGNTMIIPTGWIHAVVRCTIVLILFSLLISV
jgi:F-box/leucine-rich repeat protein 10/11